MEINNSGDVNYKVRLMGFNFATDPDDLLRKIPPNITEDVERAVKRIEGLLPSIYRGLERALENVRPGSPEQAIYHYELRVVKMILGFLDNPVVSYLIGVPFQPAAIEDKDIIFVAPMARFTRQIAILGPAKCTIMIFPVAIMGLDNMLRNAFVHELVHCVIGDPYERVTYRVGELLGNLVPDLFLPALYVPHVGRAILEYLKRRRVPVVSFEISEAVGERIATDIKYANKILDKSFIAQLKPSSFWRRLA